MSNDISDFLCRMLTSCQNEQELQHTVLLHDHGNTVAVRIAHAKRTLLLKILVRTSAIRTHDPDFIGHENASVKTTSDNTINSFHSSVQHLRTEAAFVLPSSSI